ncbi:hypothetical protein [Reyranella aquatilis]|uniref:hypothetical protein n=1 Tax=Reyranella aquatilis TaxID=2035356 RepID=UPI002E7A4415|nr:hypothetical protein [Reyranella aquatilis]
MKKRRRLCRVGKLGLELRLATFEPVHFRLHRRVVHAVCNGVDRGFDLLVDPAELHLGCLQ